jgi:oxygen-dependent protoporphyrinogen oxidase
MTAAAGGRPAGTPAPPATAGVTPAKTSRRKAKGEAIDPETDPLIQARSAAAPPTRVVVIGGGAAGLVAARRIASPGFEVTVVEASARLGGSVARHELAGIRLDSGAESFATRGGHVAALIDELGLADEVVQPLAAGAWLQLPGRAVPAPKAGLLGIPSSPLAEDVIAAIGWRGAWRAYLDRLMPVMKMGKETNLGAMVRRRMGQAVLDDLVAPVTSGVYGVAPDDIDVEAAAPGLNKALTQAGSLSGAVAALRGNASKAGSAVGGLRGGMAALIDALAADAVSRAVRLRTGVAVAALRPTLDVDLDARFRDAAGVPLAALDALAADPAHWRLLLADGEVLAADAVLLATPAEHAVRLLGEASPVLAPLSELPWIDGSDVEIVTVVVDDSRLDAAPRGTGMLVAETVPSSDVAAKALTHVTAKWPWVAEQLPPGRHVLRLSYGRPGAASPLQGRDDAQICSQAVADASALLNIPLSEHAVVASDVVRWRNAPPLAAHGQRARVELVRDRVAEVDAIEVTGSWLAGIGLASVVPDARQAAERIRALRWRQCADGTVLTARSADS